MNGLRIGLIVLFFASGVRMVITGWEMTGELNGLFVMIIGVGLLLGALAVYNKPYAAYTESGTKELSGNYTEGKADVPTRPS